MGNQAVSRMLAQRAIDASGLQPQPPAPTTHVQRAPEAIPIQRVYGDEVGGVTFKSGGAGDKIQKAVQKYQGLEKKDYIARIKTVSGIIQMCISYLKARGGGFSRKGLVSKVKGDNTYDANLEAITSLRKASSTEYENVILNVVNTRDTSVIIQAYMAIHELEYNTFSGAQAKMILRHAADQLGADPSVFKGT